MTSSDEERYANVDQAMAIQEIIIENVDKRTNRIQKALVHHGNPRISTELDPELKVVRYRFMDETLGECMDTKLEVMRFETELLRQITAANPSDVNKNEITVRGYVLKYHPVGVVCIYGTHDEISRLSFYVPKSRTYPITDRGISVDTLRLVLLELFQLEAEHKANLTYGVERVHAALSHPLLTGKSILVIQEESYNGKWFTLTLPGGKRRLGETSLDCALRECYEETGIDASQLDVSPETAYIHDSQSRVHFVAIRIGGHAPVSDLKTDRVDDTLFTKVLNECVIS